MTEPFRVLILCTANSARSQMAEAIINHRSRGRVVAESAGTRPAARVNPWAIDTLREAGIEWRGREPRALDTLTPQQWDAVITVCDGAKGFCPVAPGRPVTAHWSMPDPGEVEGSDQEEMEAFFEAFLTLSRRIELFLALPVQTLERRSLETMLRAIGRTP